MTTNRFRSLKDVVSADGWISEYDGSDEATVHADIVFRKAEFGSGASDKIRFSVQIRRAEVRFRIPSGEPVRIVKRSVERSRSEIRIEQTYESSSSINASAALSGALSAGGATLDAKAALEAGESAKRTRQEKLSVGEFMVQHFPDEGSFAWEVRSSRNGAPMAGSPWDAATEPRFRIKRLNARNADGDTPSIHLEIRCRREDLHIDDIEVKDKKLWDRIRSLPNRDANIAAAEALILDEVKSAGFLQLPAMNEPKSWMVVAELIIVEDTP